MQKQFYVLDGKGFAEQMTEQQLPKASSVVWIHGDLDSMQDTITSKANLPLALCDSILSPQSQPRVVVYKGTLVMCCRIADKSKSGGLSMDTLRIVITDNLICTISKKPVSAIQIMMNLLLSGDGPVSSTDFLVRLLAEVVDNCEQVVYKLEHNVDTLQNKLSRLADIEIDKLLKSIRQQIITLNRYLKPQRDALLKLSHVQLSWLLPNEQVYFYEYYEAHNRMLDGLSSAQAHCEVVHEQQVMQGQQKTNLSLYWLTIVATIFMPLNLIAGLLGMNVTTIPGSHGSFGFYKVCILLLLLSLGLVLYFKKKFRI